MKIVVTPGSEIVSLPPYRIPQALKSGVEEELHCLLEQGIIELLENDFHDDITDTTLDPFGTIINNRSCIAMAKFPPNH